MRDLSSVLEAVSTDLHHLSTPLPVLTILNRKTGETVGPADPSLSSEVSEPAEPGELLVRSGRRWFRVTGATEIDQQAVEIMSRLQDDVVDSLGRPWPELRLESAFAGVLEPDVVGGLAVWRSSTGFSCPLGELHAMFGHLVRW